MKDICLSSWEDLMRRTDFLVFRLVLGTVCRVQGWSVKVVVVAVLQTFGIHWVAWGRDSS